MTCYATLAPMTGGTRVRVAINGMFWQEPHVGSGQYLHNLMRAYAAQPAGDRFVLVVPRYTRPRKAQLRSVQTVIMPTPFDGINHNLAKLWFEQISLLQVARKVHADVLHVPYFGPPHHSALPTLVSVLDLIPLLLPPYRGNRLVQSYMRLAAAGARRGAGILAISRFTQAEIIRTLKIPEARVRVTYLAAAPAYAPRSEADIAVVRERFRLATPYIYYIGGFDIRKNVPLLIRAFAKLRRTYTTPLQLVLGGRPSGSDPTLFPPIERTILDEGVAPEVVMLGPVSEDENAALMSGCAAFAFPSCYEGFGLSPLEAMQCGAPVLAASTTSVAEVVAEGGILLDPDDVPAWAGALTQVVRDPAYADQLRQRGLERAGAFRWQTTAQQTLESYRAVL